MQGISRLSRARLALAGIAAAALAGAMSAGHAEAVSQLPAAAMVPMLDAGPVRIRDTARFVPSAAAAAEGLAPADTTLAPAGDGAPAEPVARALGSGIASYYGRRFAGRATASGESFDPRHFTAAHRTLPFGSLVRVTNQRNGRSVVVRINDRGPYARSREIDLSRGAAEEIGLVAAGHGKVELELLTG